MRHLRGKFSERSRKSLERVREVPGTVREVTPPPAEEKASPLHFSRNGREAPEAPVVYCPECGGRGGCFRCGTEKRGPWWRRPNGSWW
jgi:hypothetical protein